MGYKGRAVIGLLFVLLFQGCTHTNLHRALQQDMPSAGSASEMLAVYEPWFGHPRHIAVGYSSQDPVVLRKQIREAKSLGISGFVIDWYGDREPFLDRSYALLQTIAAEEKFKVAMMYDETEQENGNATDDTMAAFSKFNSTYLDPNAAGREAYLEYHGRPVVFIFPKAGHTEWSRVRTMTNLWVSPPLLIYEYRSNPDASVFDGFYAWVNPGQKGWAHDGSNWGEQYLRDFYRQMQSKYPDKIAVGAAWPGFDDSKASWGLNRFISQRCGDTLSDTLKVPREYYSAERPLPFMLIATWNDYEEGTAIERGLKKCGSGQDQQIGSLSPPNR